MGRRTIRGHTCKLRPHPHCQHQARPTGHGGSATDLELGQATHNVFARMVPEEETLPFFYSQCKMMPHTGDQDILVDVEMERPGDAALELEAPGA